MYSISYLTILQAQEENELSLIEGEEIEQIEQVDEGKAASYF